MMKQSAWRGTLAVRSLPLPGRWWLIGLLVAALAGTWATHRTLLGRDAGVTLIVAVGLAVTASKRQIRAGTSADAAEKKASAPGAQPLPIEGARNP